MALQSHPPYESTSMGNQSSFWFSVSSAQVGMKVKILDRQRSGVPTLVNAQQHPLLLPIFRQRCEPHQSLLIQLRRMFLVSKNE
jgi:hypothetical protein